MKRILARVPLDSNQTVLKRRPGPRLTCLGTSFDQLPPPPPKKKTIISKKPRLATSSVSWERTITNQGPGQTIQNHTVIHIALTTIITNPQAKTITRLAPLTLGLSISIKVLFQGMVGTQNWASPENRNEKWANQSLSNPIALIITNNCPDPIWPAIASQDGTGPGTGGFRLDPTFSVELWVTSRWQGRVWGRTNCSFNEDGTGPANLNGVMGNGMACMTGDCFGVVDCAFTVCSGLTTNSQRQEKFKLDKVHV